MRERKMADSKELFEKLMNFYINKSDLNEIFSWLISCVDSLSSFNDENYWISIHRSEVKLNKNCNYNTLGITTSFHENKYILPNSYDLYKVIHTLKRVLKT